jgi:hypothetical protein
MRAPDVKTDPKAGYECRKQSIDFTAAGFNAPVMTVESGLLPDPLDADITAERDK